MVFKLLIRGTEGKRIMGEVGCKLLERQSTYQADNKAKPRNCIQVIFKNYIHSVILLSIFNSSFLLFGKLKRHLCLRCGLPQSHGGTERI